MSSLRAEFKVKYLMFHCRTEPGPQINANVENILKLTIESFTSKFERSFTLKFRIP